jgi:hypothetical protein
MKADAGRKTVSAKAGTNAALATADTTKEARDPRE